MPTIAIRILGGKEKIKGKVNTCEGNIIKIFRLKNDISRENSYSFPENSLAYQRGPDDALNPNILKTTSVGSHMLGTKQLVGKDGWVLHLAIFCSVFLLAIGEFPKSIGVSEVHLHKAKKAL